MENRFDEKTATQSAAFFLSKNGGPMNLMKLIKLLYIADRVAIEKRGSSLTRDQPYSMSNGPVLSKIYDLIKGALVRHDHPYWTEHISERSGLEVTLLDDPGSSNLSESEVEILEGVWREYGESDQWDLSRISHKFSEWVDPKGSSVEIPLAKILEATGTPPDQAKKYEEREREFESECEKLRHIFG